MEAQSLSVKRAEVEFHNFASFGEPERAIETYEQENERRGGLIIKYKKFIGPMTPFLEIGSAAGHSSYMLANQFGQQGVALDLSADALRYGQMLVARWGLEREPVRMAGDAVHLPFADGSLRMVMAFQMLSQFQDIDAVFKEVARVLQPGGIFFFAEEPVRREFSLRLFRAPYEEQMKPWERRLHRWGLLGYLTKDVIGAHQEESFGIRQNHRMRMHDWDRLIARHFADRRIDVFIPRRGWGERLGAALARRIDRNRSDWVPARVLGGTMAAFCRKAGVRAEPAVDYDLTTALPGLLRCPDCGAEMRYGPGQALNCTACGYAAPREEGVYNLLSSEAKRALYPPPGPDRIDFSRDACEAQLIEGFHEVEGIYGNKYRWIGADATLRLERADEKATTLRVRGYVPPELIAKGQPVRFELSINGGAARTTALDRPGLFVVETPVEPAPQYTVRIHATPTFKPAGDDRELSVNLSLIQLL